MFYNKLKNEIGLLLFKRKWRNLNNHNEINPVNKFPINLVKVGKYSYGPIIIKTWNNPKEKLEIGNFVSIASGVKFILGGNHEINTISTFPFKVKFFNEKSEAWSKGPIIVKDDVWIGMDSLILSGVTIGQGAIVAAGSVVTKDVEPYSIVGGNPAKLLKYRHPKEIIDVMVKVDWSKINIDKLKNLKKELYKNLNLNDPIILKKVIMEEINEYNSI